MLSVNGEVRESGGLWFLSSQLNPAEGKNQKDADLISHPLDGLPEPHPLDFDWRFTQSTLPFLKQLVSTTNDANGAILGAPSLYKYLADLQASVSLFDKNPQIVEHLKGAGYPNVTEVDLMHRSDFSALFDWAVADPPWYPEHYEGFMKAASQLVRPGGKLLLSVLPRLTRPSAASDRFSILEMGYGFGFDLAEVHPAALGYASPAFEVEALREEGLALGNWRKGDLFGFILSSKDRIQSTFSPSKDNTNWKTIQLGTTTVRLKCSVVDDSVPFTYRTASPDGTPRLRSVSRRSPTRSEVNVWTSRNIALIVSRPRILADALIRVADGSSRKETLGTIIAQNSLNDVEASQLCEILELLLQEAGLSWE
jgi:hypothetical protein